jgi:hypothetical protein
MSSPPLETLRDAWLRQRTLAAMARGDAPPDADASAAPSQGPFSDTVVIVVPRLEAIARRRELEAEIGALTALPLVPW